MGIEAFAEAAAALVPGFRVASVEDIDFLAPFKFYRDEPRTVRVEAILRPAGDGVEAECRLVGRRSLPGQAGPQETVHFRARVKLERGDANLETVAAALENPGAPLVAAEIYSVYFHGPAYQVLESAWKNGSGVVGLFADPLPPNHVPDGLPTLVSPRLIELSFQTAGVFELGTRGLMGLPLRVERVRPVRGPGDRERAPPRGRDAVGVGGRKLRRPGRRRRRQRLPDRRRLSDRRACRGRLGLSARAVSRRDGLTLSSTLRGAASGPPRAAPRIGGHMHPEFERVAIVNRGEAAMRFINAVREFNQERGTRIRTVALYTDPDRRAMFVREADEAFGLGPATVIDPRDGERKSSYLDYRLLEAALAASKADAVWTGWGFVSEHAGFADLCERLGIVFIGPPPDAMRRLSDKISAKKLAEEARVPVVPWSGRAVGGAAEAASAAEVLGYPVLVKAAAGGGGRGIRVVSRPEEMPEAFESARHESLRAFGDATVFVEKLLRGVRHVEVQVLGDAYGTTWAVGVRDCTVQRRHQKVLEEFPRPPCRPTSTGTCARRLSGSCGPPATATPGRSSSSSTRRA